MDASAHFRGKKITVMGLGLLGGVGDIAYLAESGADIIATDLKTEEELRPSLETLKKFPNIRYTIGRHDLADFRDRDLIIKAPSTPLDSIYINEARKNGIPIAMWAALFATFAREAGATVVGITGTRGKSTVTAMLVAILREARKNVIEGGNVQGTSVLPQLANVSKETMAVLELDSWKLQGFGEARMSPHIAVFTTFFPDHLNYYGNNLNTYLADKANIFLHQKPEDTLVLGEQAEALVLENYRDAIRSHIVVADSADIPSDWRLQVPGAHNRYDAALALAAARACGVPDEVSRPAVESFAGVPGRLELVAKKGGVKVYNDTTATTPEATLAALEALEAPVILIMGGADKGLDMKELLAAISAYAKRVILLSGSGTERIRGSVPDAPVYDALKDAVADAFAHASAGDSILFSPAFTSFGMFRNEYDRGDRFIALIQTYAD